MVEKATVYRLSNGEFVEDFDEAVEKQKEIQTKDALKAIAHKYTFIKRSDAVDFIFKEKKKIFKAISKHLISKSLLAKIEDLLDHLHKEFDLSSEKELNSLVQDVNNKINEMQLP